MQVSLRGLPQSLQSRQHMASVDGDAAHHEAVRWERADCPQGFSVSREWECLFTEFVLECQPFRDASAHLRDPEGRPSAVGTEPAERLHRAHARFDAHAFADDWLAKRKDVACHFYCV